MVLIHVEGRGCEHDLHARKLLEQTREGFFFSQERFIFPFPFFPVRVNCPKGVKEPARDTWQYPSPSKADTFTNYLATPPLSFIKLGSASNRQVNSGLHISLTSPKGTDSETKRR